VRDGLSALGVQTITLDTILVFENGIAKVDLPCSGVKSLWTGGLFLLAATWIERRPINLRWVLAALGFAVALLVANLIRVAVLVTVGQVAGLTLLAEMLHVPLGVVGFTAACAAIAGVLARLPDMPAVVEKSTPAPRPVWLAPLLGGAILGMALLYAPRPETALAQSNPVWQFAPDLEVEPWALTQGERDWLAEGGILSGERWRFQWQGHAGSLLFITGNTWHAHHRPERCFQVYGLSVEGSSTHLVAGNFPIRLLSLGNRDLRGRLPAAYWLQSTSQTTDDFARRIWADLEPQRQRWILVTILFDQPAELDSAEFQEFFQALHSTVQAGLAGGL
jgi:exosortase O